MTTTMAQGPYGGSGVPQFQFNAPAYSTSTLTLGSAELQLLERLVVALEKLVERGGAA